MKDIIRWDKVSGNYENEIFSVFYSDRKKIILKHFNKLKNKKNTAIDFGCGIGGALSMLSPSFKSVLAMDISKGCIKKAKALGYKNVEFKRADLTIKRKSWPKVDFVLCSNVAISDKTERNYKILRNAIGTLKKGGAALIMLPSLESVSFATENLIRWNEKKGFALSKIPAFEMEYLKLNKEEQILEGIIHIEDAPTKHYSLPEIYNFFNAGKFVVKAIERIEYDWNTEFEAPPQWMKAPYPFDWMVEVQRVK